MQSYQLWYEQREVPVRWSRIEDELIDVVLLEPAPIEVGDMLVIQLYAKRFDVRVVRRSNEQLQLFSPLLHRDGEWNDRRGYTRLETSLCASVLSGLEMIPIRITDMSITGFGFTSGHQIDDLEPYPLILCTELLTIAPIVRITHTMEGVDGFKYGAEIQSMRPEEQQRLRSYLLFYHLISEAK